MKLKSLLKTASISVVASAIFIGCSGSDSASSTTSSDNNI